MGIRVELPLCRKKRPDIVREKSVTGARVSNIDEVALDWPSLPHFFEHYADDIRSPSRQMSNNFREPVRGTAPVFESPSSKKHLISPGPSENRYSSSYFASPPVSPATTPSSAASPPVVLRCDPYSDRAAHLRLNKNTNARAVDSVSFSCAGDSRHWRHSRWDVDWSGEMDRNSKSRVPSKGGVCRCAAGLTADMAAVCCCPLSLLHLLALALVKLPSVVVYRSVLKLKRKIVQMRKKGSSSKQDDDVSVQSRPPSRTASHDSGDTEGWNPALGFSDGRLWRDYFDSPDTGVWSSGESRRRM